MPQIRSAGKLDHKNIVRAHGAEQIGELIVLTMEFIDGEDLAKRVESKGPLPIAEAAEYIHQTAEGLQHAFEMGMVHRDIKPQNLILSMSGVVKILDFGLAKATRDGGVDTGLTGMDQMLGTACFMAPEQFSDASNADTRADVYSLACTFYYLLTGTAPFKAKSPAEFMYAHLTVEPKPVHMIRPAVSVQT